MAELDLVGVAPRRKRTLVLMEPPFCFWDRTMDRLREGEETIPGIGILILAAMARERGYDVHVVDAKRAGTTNEAAAARIAALRPDVVGLSCTTISVTNGARVAAAIKEVLPACVTIVGGAHVSAVPERTLERCEAFDFGIVGEGEHSLFELMTRLEQGRCVRDVPGLVYRDDPSVAALVRPGRGPIRANPRAAYIEDLDALPPPAWDLVPNFPYAFSPSMFNYRRTPVATLITQRGCPFSCTFCDRSTSGKRGRWHSVEYVVRLLDQMRDAGVKHILFYDDLFTVNKARVRQLCEAMLDRGFDFSWSCNSHPNLLDPETMALMKRAGCWQIAYGIESGSQRVLNHVKHEVKLPRLLDTLRMTRAAGLKIKGLMMCAHPTETVESLEETNRFLRTAPLDLMQLTKFTPYPGTPSYPTIHEHGAFEEDWERMNAMNFVFIPNGLDEATLEHWFDRMYRTFYTRPDVLLGLARLVVEEPQFLRRLGGYAKPYLARAVGRLRRLGRDRSPVPPDRPAQRRTLRERARAGRVSGAVARRARRGQSMLSPSHGSAPTAPVADRSQAAPLGAVEPRASAPSARFRHDGVFWRRFAHWGSTRAPLWWRRVGPSIVATIVFALLRENRRNAIANLRQRRGARGAIADNAEALRLFHEFAYCVSEAFEFASPSGQPVEIESPIGLDPSVLLGEGRGAVVLTSHFGTWEIGARVMQKYTSRVNVVMAREANPSVEAYQQQIREGSGLRVIHSDSSVFSSLNMIHALRRGEIVALQLDRGAPGQVTRRIDFFGKPAPFQYGPFALARLAGVPIWPVLVARTGPRRYRFLPEPLRTIRRNAGEAETLAVMEDVVRSFERTIREYPRQWFQFRPFWD